MERGEYLKQLSASSERNKDPILNVLRRVLPDKGLVLEVASGTGQHAVHFAGALPDLTWQPSDVDPGFRASVEAWRAETNLPNIMPPVHLDTTDHPWPIDQADAVINSNMIHIAPWEVCIGLLDGAARLLPEGGILFMYGPYRIGGEHTTDSNAAFDQSLRMRDPSWGIRDLGDVVSEAASRGLEHVETVQMPANNLSVVYRKVGST
ncbi:MAG: DUF938 domain-containing protein [Rhodospirillales bacterium]|nr:DUF938 domain-containing protein [Rhodospirillales bacterium]